jgi:dTDP-4-amino-4,6-dideoxygalactose transaminase
MSANPTVAEKATPVRTTPLPGLPPRFDGREAELLNEALRRNNLFYNQPDGLTARFTQRAAEQLNAPFAVATSSGTAALHAAVIAAGVRPGAEVITSPITDMGTCIAILYQNAIPIFADLDERTYNLTPASVEAAITDRTEAVILVHLTGNPADADAIAAVCRKRGIKLIEDCAQAWGATYKGKAVGNVGDFGCYSLNNFKHLSCGDGGLVLTQTQADFYAAHNAADKFYDRHAQGVRLTQLAPNYRMSELQSAVALAQLDRLESIAAKRRALGDALSAELAKLPGVLPPRTVEGGQPSYWFYMFRVDEAAIGMSRDAFTAKLGAEGIPAGNGYIGRPINREPVFLSKAFFPGEIWPAEVIAKRTYDYAAMPVPSAERILKTAVNLQIHEGLSASDIQDYVKAVRRAVAR